MTLEQLGQVKAASVSKKREEVWNAPAAVNVLTRNDIRRFGKHGPVRGIESGDS